MTKEFIPYEQALALKELGFDKNCMYAYCEKGGWNKYRGIKEPITIILRSNGNPFGQYNNGSNWNKQYDVNKNKIQCSTPTYSQVFRWFREKYELLNHLTTHLNPYGEDGALEESYGYRIMFNRDGWKCKVWEELSFFDTYEEAELECLKKLIEIVKEN